jgi:hypothetical protein
MEMFDAELFAIKQAIGLASQQITFRQKIFGYILIAKRE